MIDPIKNSIREFLDKPLPDRVGWPHIFGSMLLALFGLQFLTGFLLSFVYAASPLSAYPSIRYLMDEMDGGSWLRGIHFWGASTIIVVLALHLIRTFIYAAYKRPRQFTWVLGVLLLLCALAFAQTGFLLPWDQKAYWGTKVTIEIIGTTPILGPTLAYLARGGASVGALTLSRFFTIHVAILPIFTVLLVLGHLLLIRRFGITAPWSNVDSDPPRNTPFHPFQTARDATGMLLITAVVLILASLVPPSLGLPADPNDNTFVPRPDWYFLFLFQSLTYLKGPMEMIGTFLLPTLGILALILLPFYDKNPSRSPKSRPFALAALLAGILLWSYLTYAAVEHTPRPSSSRPEGILVSRAERIKRPSEVGGMYVLKERCFECHSMTVFGARPSLQILASHHFPTGGPWLKEHMEGQGRKGEFTDKEVEELMSVLRLVAGGQTRLLYSIPISARFGGHKFFTSSCSYCHRIDGQGGEQSEVAAPDLTLRLLRARDWHIKHIKDAGSVTKGSQMPPFLHYEPYEYEALADYILYLHTP